MDNIKNTVFRVNITSIDLALYKTNGLVQRHEWITSSNDISLNVHLFGIFRYIYSRFSLQMNGVFMIYTDHRGEWFHGLTTGILYGSFIGSPFKPIYSV